MAMCLCVRLCADDLTLFEDLHGVKAACDWVASYWQRYFLSIVPSPESPQPLYNPVRSSASDLLLQPWANLPACFISLSQNDTSMSVAVQQGETYITHTPGHADGGSVLQVRLSARADRRCRE